MQSLLSGDNLPTAMPVPSGAEASAATGVSRSRSPGKQATKEAHSASALAPLNAVSSA